VEHRGASEANSQAIPTHDEPEGPPRPLLAAGGPPGCERHRPTGVLHTRKRLELDQSHSTGLVDLSRIRIHWCFTQEVRGSVDHVGQVRLRPGTLQSRRSRLRQNANSTGSLSSSFSYARELTVATLLEPIKADSLALTTVIRKTEHTFITVNECSLREVSSAKSYQGVR
jgi:hypothetical protein